MCWACFPSYYYDKEKNQCFFRCQCGKRGFYFRTGEECSRTCMKNPPTKPTSKLSETKIAKIPICEQPKTLLKGSISCLAAFPRYFFNKDTKKCEFFIYGGCGASENNFRSLEECIQTCMEDPDDHECSGIDVSANCVDWHPTCFHAKNIYYLDDKLVCRKLKKCCPYGRFLFKSKIDCLDRFKKCFDSKYGQMK